MYNKQLLGVFENTTFHFIKNENSCNLFNASEIAEFLQLDLSDFIESEVFNVWMKNLLDSDEPLKDCNLEFDDLIIMQDEKIYLHRFLIYELIKNIRMDFYWWYDQLFQKQMSQYAKEKVMIENNYNNL